MRYVFFAALLVTLQAPPPVPRQAAKDHADKAGTKAQIPQNGQQSSAPSPPNASVNQPTEADTTSKSAENKAHNTSPSAPKNENWSRSETLSLVYDIETGILVIIGGLGVCFALRTLKALEAQTNILADGQRPRIVVNSAEHPTKTLSDDPAAPRVVLEITNKGPMPATDCRYQSWIEVLPDTSGDFTSNADHFQSGITSVLYPDSPHAINIPLHKGISSTDWPLVRSLKKHVCVRLYVEYQDPFIPTRRCYMDFGAYILPNGFGWLEKHNGVGFKDKKS